MIREIKATQAGVQTRPETGVWSRGEAPRLAHGPRAAPLTAPGGKAAQVTSMFRLVDDGATRPVKAWSKLGRSLA